MKYVAQLIALLALSLPVAASAQDLAVHTGATIIPSFFGQTPSDGSTERDLSGQLGIDLTFDLGDVLQFGGSFDGSYVDGRYRDRDGSIYDVSLGPTVLVHSKRWTGRDLVFTGSITPGAMFAGASGEGQSHHGLLLGAMAETSIRFRLTQSFSLGGFGSFGIYSPPLTGDVWMGEKLGLTMRAAIGLGIVWHF